MTDSVQHSNRGSHLLYLFKRPWLYTSSLITISLITDVRYHTGSGFGAANEIATRSGKADKNLIPVFSVLSLLGIVAEWMRI